MEEDFRELWSKEEIVKNSSDFSQEHTDYLLVMYGKKAEVYDILSADQAELKQKFVLLSLDEWLCGDDISKAGCEIAIGDYANINFDPERYSSEKNMLGTMRWIPFNQDIAIYHFTTFNENINNKLYLNIGFKKVYKNN